MAQQLRFLPVVPPISSEAQDALDLKADASALTSHTGNTSNPHSVTKAQVGLGNVDNTSDANKPVSTAQQTALNLKANLASPTFTGTVSGITKAMVGLGNVDNTADTAKPVSTAQQTALNLKANLASPTFTGTVSGATLDFSGNATINAFIAKSDCVIRGTVSEGGQLIFGYTGATAINGQANGTWNFDVSNVDAFRIFKQNNSGTVANILNISETTGLAVWYNGLEPRSTAQATPCEIVWNSATTGDNLFTQYLTEGSRTVRGSVDYNRTGTAVRYNTTSDARLKRDLGPCDYAWDVISALRVHRYTWASDPTNLECLGFFAQELAELVPDAVRVGGEDPETDPWQLDTSAVVPILVAALQEAMRRIEALEARLQH